MTNPTDTLATISDALTAEGYTCVNEDTWPDGWSVQRDRSGQGHAWTTVEPGDIPPNIAEEIRTAMIESGPDDDTMSNGQRYRWFRD